MATLRRVCLNREVPNHSMSKLLWSYDDDRNDVVSNISVLVPFTQTLVASKIFSTLSSPMAHAKTGSSQRFQLHHQLVLFCKTTRSQREPLRFEDPLVLRGSPQTHAVSHLLGGGRGRWRQSQESAPNRVVGCRGCLHFVALLASLCPCEYSFLWCCCMLLLS